MGNYQQVRVKQTKTKLKKLKSIANKQDPNNAKIK